MNGRHGSSVSAVHVRYLFMAEAALDDGDLKAVAVSEDVAPPVQHMFVEQMIADDATSD